MAISSGVGPHAAWVSVNGATFPVEKGSVSLAATKKSGSFSAEVALAYPGAEAALSALGDNTATITVLARGQQATLFTGEVDETSFEYLPSGMIKLSGRDKSAKLHETKTAEKWINKQPGDIIQDLASRVGLGTNIDPLALKAGRITEIDWAKLTDNVSYGFAIHKLAEFMGAHWYVDQNGTLNVKIGSASDAPYAVNYSPGPPKNADIFRLEVRRNVQAGKGVQVTVKSWHPHKKQRFVGTSTIGGKGTPKQYTYHLPGLTQDHVDQHAKAKAKDHARHEFSVEIEMVGDPSIRVSQPLQLNGTAFAQTLDIDSITHRFGMGGFTTSISAKKQTGKSA